MGILTISYGIGRSFAEASIAVAKAKKHKGKKRI